MDNRHILIQSTPPLDEWKAAHVVPEIKPTQKYKQVDLMSYQSNNHKINQETCVRSEHFTLKRSEKKIPDHNCNTPV